MSATLPSVAPTTAPLPPVRVVNWGNLVFCAVSLLVSFTVSFNLVRRSADEQALQAVLPTHMTIRRVALPGPLSNATVLTAGEYGVIDVARKLVTMFALPLLHQLRFDNESRLDKVLTISELYRQVWLLPPSQPTSADDRVGDGELMMLHLCDAHACVTPALLSTLMRMRPQRISDEALSSQSTQTFVRIYAILFGEVNASAVVSNELGERGVVTATNPGAGAGRWHTQPLYGTWPQNDMNIEATPADHATVDEGYVRPPGVQGRCDRCGLCSYRETITGATREVAGVTSHRVITTQFIERHVQSNTSQRGVRCDEGEDRGGETWYETLLLPVQEVRFGDSRTLASLPELALVHIDVGARHALAALTFMSGLISLASATTKGTSVVADNVLVALYLTEWWLPTLLTIRRLQTCCSYHVLLLQGSQCAVYMANITAHVTADELKAIGEGYARPRAYNSTRPGGLGEHAMQPMCTMLLTRLHSSISALLRNVTAVSADQSAMLRFFASANATEDVNPHWAQWRRGRRWWALLLLVPLSICTLLLRGLARRCKHSK